MQNEITIRIMDTMAAVFAMPVSDLSDISSVDNIASWDSLKHMNLILALEEEFNITIPDEDVGNMTNFRMIEFVVRDNYGK